MRLISTVRRHLVFFAIYRHTTSSDSSTGYYAAKRISQACNDIHKHGVNLHAIQNIGLVVRDLGPVVGGKKLEGIWG